jgi:hypothetical protein
MELLVFLFGLICVFMFKFEQYQDKNSLNISLDNNTNTLKYDHVNVSQFDNNYCSLAIGSYINLSKNAILSDGVNDYKIVEDTLVKVINRYKNS